jgi:hypothetical protein
MESPASQAEPAARGARRLGMYRRPGEQWTRFAGRVANAFGLVLLLVIAIYILASLVSYSGWGGFALSVTTGTCGVVALVSAEASRHLIRLAVIGAVVATAGSAAAALGAGSAFAGVAALILVALLMVAAAEVLGTVLTESEVGFRTILGAISVYVILGILFSFVYSAVDKLQSGLFFGTPIQTGDFIFFSITTLTTTGYGDLVPAAQPGRMLSGLEMLIGQIFLVTLIAGLVSLWRPGGWARRRERAKG